MKRDLVKVDPNSVPTPPNGEALAPTSSAPVPVDERPEIMQLLQPAERKTLCSWDVTTDEGEWLLQKCEEDQDDRLRNLIGQELQVEHFMVKSIPDYMDKETGEVRPILRTVLVTPDRDVYGCSSGGVAEALSRFCMRYGAKGFKPPLTVRVVQRALEDKRVRLTLLRTFPQFEKKGKK